MDSEEVLSVLFGFVGVGHFLYVAGVSRSWRRHYTTTTAKAEAGALMTRWQDGMATIPCLEYGFANDLEFTPEFHPEKDDFGPCVYEWARQHGFPLYVWVATQTCFEAHAQRGGKFTAFVIGVLSTFGKAKEAAVEHCNNNFADIGRSQWTPLFRGGSMLGIMWDEGRDVYTIKAFAVEEVDVADGISPLILYVTCRTHSGDVFSKDQFVVEGVFATKKLANESVNSMVLCYDRFSAKVSSKEEDLWSYTVDEKSIKSRYATEWAGYLDGEGGKPGDFFKNVRRKREEDGNQR